MPPPTASLPSRLAQRIWAIAQVIPSLLRFVYTCRQSVARKRIHDFLRDVRTSATPPPAVAVAGFCFGGSYSFALAAADPRIRAAVPFYGYPPESTSVATIGCPVLALYGDADERLMESLPALTAAMADARVTFTAQTYEGAGHAFFNDTNPTTYVEDAAADAFARSLAFLHTNLAA